MRDYLCIPNHLKDIKDHILNYMKIAKSFSMKSNSFQRKHELITTPFLLH